MKSLSLLRCLPISVVVMAILTGCAAPTEKSADGATSVSSAPIGGSCSESQHLLTDTEFQGLAQDTWSYIQHSGPQSFRVVSEQGELELARIGDEPWMLLQQTVKDERFKGATLVYRVELKGEGLEGNFGFEPKAGIYTRIGTGGRAQLAPQGPNLGDWEWQTFEERIPLPSAVDRVQVGLVYQTGGVVLARNPSLVIERCELDEGA